MDMMGIWKTEGEVSYRPRDVSEVLRLGMAAT